MKSLAILLVPLSLIVMGVGVWWAWLQNYRITTYVPVPATVQSTQTITHHSRGNVRYSSNLTFLYEINGRIYSSNHVLPVSRFGNPTWTQDISDRYQAGQKCEAYYNRQQPDEVFLCKQYDFDPYLYILASVLLMSIGVGVLVAKYNERRHFPKPVSTDGNWFELQPFIRLGGRFEAAMAVAIIWWAAGFLACGHYFFAAIRPYDVQALVLCPIYGAVGLIPVSIALHYWKIRQEISDVCVLVSTKKFQLGDTFKIRMAQKAFLGLTLDRITISLVCYEDYKEEQERGYDYGTRKAYQQDEGALKGRQVQSGEIIATTETLTVPTDEQPSSPPRFHGYPRYRWQIEVNTRISQRPEYHAAFPIIVESPGKREHP